MSHIAVDLKVIEVSAPAVARAAGVDPDRVLAGLVRLWHRCWSCKSDRITTIEAAGVFGGDRIEAVIAALEAFGLFQKLSDAVWRVKGADRYLRIQAGRSAGGKAASGNLKRGTKRPADSRQVPGSPPADSRQVPGLSPSTEHRAPNTEQKASAAKKPAAGVASRLQDLREALEADYAAVREGARYKHGGAKDTQALKELLPVAADEEIRGRWCHGLRAPSTAWASCSTFAQLGSKWNDLAAPLPEPPRPRFERFDPNEGIIRSGGPLDRESHS